MFIATFMIIIIGIVRAIAVLKWIIQPTVRALAES